MALVIPRWQARNVADWKALLVVNDDGSKQLSAASVVILNYMSLIGVPTLTADNAADAWCRIAIWEALFGAMAEAPETSQPLFVTRADVLRHVGLETESDFCSFTEFCACIHRRAMQTDTKAVAALVANGGRTLLEHSGVSPATGAVEDRANH